jgi:hypothetical protein
MKKYTSQGQHVRRVERLPLPALLIAILLAAALAFTAGTVVGRVMIHPQEKLVIGHSVCLSPSWAARFDDRCR